MLTKRKHVKNEKSNARIAFSVVAPKKIKKAQRYQCQAGLFRVFKVMYMLWLIQIFKINLCNKPTV